MRGKSNDEVFMVKALRLAERAQRLHEVPVGAVVVRGGAIIGRGFNQREGRSDPLHHAEMAAIRQASRHLKNWRLTGCVLYATLEPCAMCAGACVNARVSTIVYGCADPKGGYVTSLGAIATDPRLNHRCQIRGGVLEAECAAILRQFFRARRKK
jgi:tRNA(adenine34) deaminase